MALMSEIIEIEPSSFKEGVEKPVWVDVVVEEYNSILRNNILEVLPRLIDKSMVGSIWFYMVKHAPDRSIEKQKAKFVAKRFS